MGQGQTCTWRSRDGNEADLVRRLTQSTQPRERSTAIRGLARIPSPKLSTLEALADALCDEDAIVHSTAARVLARVGAEAQAVAPRLLQALAGENEFLRIRAARILDSVLQDKPGKPFTWCDQLHYAPLDETVLKVQDDQHDETEEVVLVPHPTSTTSCRPRVSQSLSPARRSPGGPRRADAGPVRFGGTSRLSVAWVQEEVHVEVWRFRDKGHVWGHNQVLSQACSGMPVVLEGLKEASFNGTHGKVCGVRKDGRREVALVHHRPGDPPLAVRTHNLAHVPEWPVRRFRAPPGPAVSYVKPRIVQPEVVDCRVEETIGSKSPTCAGKLAPGARGAGGWMMVQEAQATALVAAESVAVVSVAA
mmetsp:Transcript_25379/g.65229  ORF Transcript_25379/g.65229 Transcript_25379/m.65229 type:complete len:363 (-) Transcript_25379:322-1410(-)